MSDSSSGLLTKSYRRHLQVMGGGEDHDHNQMYVYTSLPLFYTLLSVVLSVDRLHLTL